MTNPYRSPKSEGVSGGGRDWLLISARGFSALALVPIALMLYELWAMTDQNAVQIADRFYFYAGAVFCLSTLSGFLFGIRKFSSSRQSIRET